MILNLCCNDYRDGIAAACNALPELLDEIERLRRLVGEMENNAYSGEAQYGCPYCKKECGGAGEMMKMGFFWKWVMTVSTKERKVRLVRFGYNRPSPGGSTWISWVVSITLRMRVYEWQSSFEQWYLTVLGLGVHFRRSAGGYES